MWLVLVITQCWQLEVCSRAVQAEACRHCCDSLFVTIILLLFTSHGSPTWCIFEIYFAGGGGEDESTRFLWHVSLFVNRFFWMVKDPSLYLYLFLQNCEITVKSLDCDIRFWIPTAGSATNSALKTFHGVDVMGHRLAEEVGVTISHSSKRISF